MLLFDCKLSIRKPGVTNLFAIAGHFVMYQRASAGLKLDNAGSPPQSSFGAPKIFFLDGNTKERAPKGRCLARGVWGHAPPEKFAKFDLILEAFCAF